MNKIIAASSLMDAQSVLKTPTAKSVQAMAKYTSALKATAVLAPVASLVEFGADIYADPSIGTTFAGEANLAAGAASAWSGAQIGAFFGGMTGPLAPVAVPVLAGVFGAVGYLAYEFGGGSTWVKTNAKQWWNSW